MYEVRVYSVRVKWRAWCGVCMDGGGTSAWKALVGGGVHAAWRVGGGNKRRVQGPQARSFGGTGGGMRLRPGMTT